MRIDTLSTFPRMYDSVMGESMMKRAQEKGILSFFAHDLRDWTDDRHRTTDDDPYGGGNGLVMKCDPIFRALDEVVGRREPGTGRASCSSRRAAARRPDAHADRSRAGRGGVRRGHYEAIDERRLRPG